MEDSYNQKQEWIEQILDKLAGIINSEVKVYTITQVADILQCEESTVKNIIFRSKELSTCRIGKNDPIRIRHEDLALFLKNRRSPCVFDEVLQ